MVAMSDIQEHHQCVHGGQPQVTCIVSMSKFLPYTSITHMTKYYLWENVFVRCKIASHNVPRAVLYKGFLILVYQEYYSNN